MSYDTIYCLDKTPVIALVKTVIDPLTGKRIEGYAITMEDVRQRPDWVDSSLRRYARQVEYYIRTGRIE